MPKLRYFIHEHSENEAKIVNIPIGPYNPLVGQGFSFILVVFGPKLRDGFSIRLLI